MPLSIFTYLLDWSEVWAILLPLGVWLFHRRQPTYMQPIITYLWVALLLNIICDTLTAIGYYYYSHKLPIPPYINNIAFYTAHSIIRFLLVLQFFYHLHRFGKKWIRYALLAFLVCMTCNEIFTVESLLSVKGIRGNLFTVESFLSLILCMAYFLKLIQSDVQHFRHLKDFWIVAGFTTYFVINFFVFLFYNPLLVENAKLASQIWDVHNISFILLSIFIAIAFYVQPRPKY